MVGVIIKGIDTDEIGLIFNAHSIGDIIIGGEILEGKLIITGIGLNRCIIDDDLEFIPLGIGGEIMDRIPFYDKPVGIRLIKIPDAIAIRWI